MTVSFSPDSQRGGGIGEMLYNTIDRDLSSARIQKRETFAVNGTTYDCTVIEVRHKPETASRFTFWIDGGRGIVLRRAFEGRQADGTTQSTLSTIRSVQMNVSLPEEVFQFVPPDGAREVDSIPGALIAFRRR